MKNEKKLDWVKNEKELAKKYYEGLCLKDHDEEDLLLMITSIIGSGHVFKQAMDISGTEEEMYLIFEFANRINLGLPLSPIMETDTLMKCATCCLGDKKDVEEYYFERYPKLHKIIQKDKDAWYHEDGRITFIPTTVSESEIIFSEMFEEIIDKNYPITLPYYPKERVRAYYTQFSYHQKKEDTVCLQRIISDRRDSMAFYIYYKKDKNGNPVEISRSEFAARWNKIYGE